MNALSALAWGGNAVNSRGARGNTLLMAAVDLGNLPAVNLLVRASADLELLDEKGSTALHHAIQRDRVEIADRLLAAGANLQRINKAGESALAVAMQVWRPEMIAVLLQHGADPFTEISDGRLIHCAAWHRQRDLIAALIAIGENINRPASRDGATPLIRAAQHTDTNGIRGVLEFHPNLNAQATSGHTALMEAAWRGRVAVCEVLLGAGADPKITTTNGDSAYSLAGQHGHAAVLKLLEDAGASPVPLFLPSNNAAQLSPARRFALAMGALELYYYGRKVDAFRADPSTILVVRHQLGISDGVADATQLRRKLDALAAAIPARPAGDLANVAALSSEEFQAALAAVADDPVKLLALQRARTRGPTGHQRMAWQLCHHNYLAASGVAASWLTTDEAWTRMLAAAKTLRSHFKSWNEIAPQLGEGLHEFESDSARIDLLLTLLLNSGDRNSPWTLSPFAGSGG